jgi:hypothetical protein
MEPQLAATTCSLKQYGKDWWSMTRIGTGCTNLNRSAGLVWQHSDGRKGVAEMAALLQRELDFTADEVVVRLKTTSPGPGLAWLALNQLERAAFE